MSFRTKLEERMVVRDMNYTDVCKEIDMDKVLAKDEAYLNKNQEALDKATEVADRDSARKREVEIAKVRKFDFLFTLTGLVGLGTFVFLVYAIVVALIISNL